MHIKKQKLLAIVGPTASGKSSLAVFLAQKLGGEVISADSRQVYKRLDIGTGKITTEEMAGVPHHLLNMADPKDQYTVTDFVRDAKAAITDISSRGKLPIICGGTGLYIDTLLFNKSIPEVSPNKKLREELESKTADELFEMLSKKDPDRAATIDPKNPRRLVRALEIVEALEEVPAQTTVDSPFNPLFIGISTDPETLKQKIKARLISRIEGGMIEEVQALHENDLSWERLDDLGLEYRFVAKHLKGELSKEELTEQLYVAICQYAKRQMTWFKRNKAIAWVTSAEEALDVAKKAGL